MIKKFVFAVAAAAATVAATAANAATTIAGTEVDLTAVVTFGATVVGALVLLIPVRKAIKIANR